MEEKDFDGWIKVKENVHYYGRMPNIKEGEIWWCAVGENVGVEINGKSDAFSRPVLVMKKLSRFGFLEYLKKISPKLTNGVVRVFPNIYIIT